jgi:murein DD-endopeptidase MepM/ murein hydrolase activator NlpD
LIYGVTGSGKTTLAEQIATRSGLPWYSVDDLTWEPGCGLHQPTLRHPGQPRHARLRTTGQHQPRRGIVTRYCHAVALDVVAGEQVVAGQVIGLVGSTGNSSGPHLHFEVHHSAPPATSDTAVDPVPHLQAVGLNP